MPPRIHNLTDGRRIAVAEYGPCDGRPVFYMHGTPSAHSEWELFGSSELLERLGIRIISPDRPGMGGSDFAPGRQVGHWPMDVSQIADALAVPRFGLIGYSGGAAYAAATALSLLDRVTGLTLVAPALHKEGLTEGLSDEGLRLKEFTRTFPFFGRLMLMLMMGFPSKYAPGMLRGMLRQTLPRADMAVLEEGGKFQIFAKTLAEAFRQGSKGPQHDMGLMASQWGIEFHKLSVPVSIWQGELDNFGARPAMARYLASALGASRLAILQEGHLSIFSKHIEEILLHTAPK